MRVGNKSIKEEKKKQLLIAEKIKKHYQREKVTSPHTMQGIDRS
jgi:hypothetical protein